MTRDDLADRGAFAERLRVQVAARYRITVEVDDARFALRLAATPGGGSDAVISLSALHAACLREPGRASALIADFVRNVEKGAVPPVARTFSTGRLVWCVRTEEYVHEHGGHAELLVVEVAADLRAFVAETLPGSVMRGVARGEWESAGIDEATVRRAADANTAALFTGMRERVLTAGRVPRDGWSLTGDLLLQGSMLVVPEMLAAFTERAGGDVYLAVPDRARVLAVPVEGTDVEAFRRRVVQQYRDALNACSKAVLVTDGRAVTEVTRPHAPPRERVRLMGWLRG